jgi:hypothetical protein
MFHNGYLTHPDIWMLWFSFFVASAVTLNYVVLNLMQHLLRSLTVQWRLSTIIAKVLDKWLGPK